MSYRSVSYRSVQHCIVWILCSVTLNSWCSQSKHKAKKSAARAQTVITPESIRVLKQAREKSIDHLIELEQELDVTFDVLTGARVVVPERVGYGGWESEQGSYNAQLKSLIHNDQRAFHILANRLRALKRFSTHVRDIGEEALDIHELPEPNNTVDTTFLIERLLEHAVQHTPLTDEETIIHNITESVSRALYALEDGGAEGLEDPELQELVSQEWKKPLRANRFVYWITSTHELPLLKKFIAVVHDDALLYVAQRYKKFLLFDEVHRRLSLLPLEKLVSLYNAHRDEWAAQAIIAQTTREKFMALVKRIPHLLTHEAVRTRFLSLSTDDQKEVLRTAPYLLLSTLTEPGALTDQEKDDLLQALQREQELYQLHQNRSLADILLDDDLELCWDYACSTRSPEELFGAVGAHRRLLLLPVVKRHILRAPSQILAQFLAQSENESLMPQVLLGLTAEQFRALLVCYPQIISYQPALETLWSMDRETVATFFLREESADYLKNVLQHQPNFEKKVMMVLTKDPHGTKLVDAAEDIGFILEGYCSNCYCQIDHLYTDCTAGTFICMSCAEERCGIYYWPDPDTCKYGTHILIADGEPEPGGSSSHERNGSTLSGC